MSVWKKYTVIMGLALSLPSTILGISFVVYKLYKNGIISQGVGLIILLISIANIFYIMVRYVLKRKNKSSEI